MPPTLDRLRRFTLRRTFPAPTTLGRALARLAFVQADPIRAPARAQELTLRHRVAGYRTGDLDRRYARLPIEEDFFVNYGYVSTALHRLMHPRTARTPFTRTQRARAEAMLAFVQAHGVVHPRDVDAHFDHGSVRNWFGGSSSATTQLLDMMHYRGLVRVAGRDGGTRLYAVREPHAAHDDPDVALDTLVDAIVAIHAPLPTTTLAWLVNRLQHATPQWGTRRRATLARAKARLAQQVVDGVTYHWPAEERLPARAVAVPPVVRLLAPFDPLVWDRVRFEQIFGWAYRFEAYTPAAKRVRGYYALPLLWGDQVIGWGNLAVRDGVLAPDLGYVRGRAPVDGAFTTALEAELAAMAAFLGVAAPGGDGGARDAFDRDVGAGARSTGARRAGVRDEASRAGSP